MNDMRKLMEAVQDYADFEFQSDAAEWQNKYNIDKQNAAIEYFVKKRNCVSMKPGSEEWNDVAKEILDYLGIEANQHKLGLTTHGMFNVVRELKKR